MQIFSEHQPVAAMASRLTGKQIRPQAQWPQWEVLFASQAAGAYATNATLLVGGCGNLRRSEAKCLKRQARFVSFSEANNPIQRIIIARKPHKDCAQ